jgi:hypothetical protein
LSNAIPQLFRFLPFFRTNTPQNIPIELKDIPAGAGGISAPYIETEPLYEGVKYKTIACSKEDQNDAVCHILFIAPFSSSLSYSAI